MREFTYTVQDELGLHARPAGMLVKRAAGYKSNVQIEKGGASAPAKRLFAVMGLSVKQGDTVRFTVDGEDEETACADLQQFCAENF